MKVFKILNLQAGLGGNRKKWPKTVVINGEVYLVKVTAVELEPDIAAVYQAGHPEDEVIVGDANQYLLDHADEFDLVWGSPPCQTHSRMMKATRHKKYRFTDMTLYQYVLFLDHFYSRKKDGKKRLWVVENVKPYYDPLIQPTAILGRHYFWSNFPIPHFEVPQPKGFIVTDGVKGAEALKNWLGIHYEGNIYYKDNHSPAQVLRNCVHPDLGLHVFNSALGIKKEPIQIQQDLFKQAI